MRAAGVVAAFALACAPPQTSGRDAGLGAASDAALADDQVAVLPLQKVVVEGGMSPDSIALIRASFDTLLEVAAAGERPKWSWSREVIAAYRRNPLLIPDPRALSLGGLETGELREVMLPADLSTQLRRILAATGDRRFMIVPEVLRLARGEAMGGSRLEVTFILVDARRGIAVWRRAARVESSEARRAIQSLAMAAAAALP